MKRNELERGEEKDESGRGEARILSIQDISCFGKCSLTVALPILSACGIETAVLPAALLSTHTGGFSGYTFKDLSEEMPKIAAHWKAEGICFDAIYTGYLGSRRQIEYVKDIFRELLSKEGLRIVDPVMADHGRLYRGFDESFVEEMQTLCRSADILLPNITEAALLSAMPYQEGVQSEAYIREMLERLGEIGSEAIILKGIMFDPDHLGVAVYETKKGSPRYYFRERYADTAHGTGDCFASVFCGALLRGESMYAAAALAADFVLDALKKTGKDPAHWYGVRFEKALPGLIAYFS
ncbi:MAG: pyridoxamine kinase [Johnsonella sp.]|nr:pyridoxamine kinase [Johnsonella sp.]